MGAVRVHTGIVFFAFFQEASLLLPIMGACFGFVQQQPQQQQPQQQQGRQQPRLNPARPWAVDDWVIDAKAWEHMPLPKATPPAGKHWHYQGCRVAGNSRWVVGHWRLMDGEAPVAEAPPAEAAAEAAAAPPTTAAQQLPS